MKTSMSGPSIGIMKSVWGMSGSWEDILSSIAEAGYAGVEAPPPMPEDAARFNELLRRHNLHYVAMIFTGGRTADEHLNAFAEQAAYAAQFGPVLVNAHSAKDCFSFEDQVRYFRGALDIERSLDIQVGHETHRGRAMFTPWGTAALLRELPDLRITADFSHWVCVCESLLEEQAEDMAIAISRTIHIHARVGYPEGPQVPHPAAPEYANELAAHEGWWRRIAELSTEQGRSLTVTPEFGPADSGYMHRLPFTAVPVADLWQICLWMKMRIETALQLGPKS